MTFDQIVYGLSGNDSNEKMTVSEIIRLIEILRQEYAPTILLTKNQYKEFKAGHTLEEVIARMQRLADSSSNDSADGYIDDYMIVRSYLHPETIKVFDE
ncbi:MAG: hypothetical protein ACTIOK_16010 [Enterococcus malodoratus]